MRTTRAQTPFRFPSTAIRLSGALLVLLLGAPQSLGQEASDEVSIGEVIQLLRIGVAAPKVAQLVEERGARGLANAEQLAQAKNLGAGDDLLDLLARRSARVKRIRSLAERFTRYDTKKAPFQMLVPVGWRIERHQTAETTLLLLRPQDAVAANWMEAPTLFVYIMLGTPLPDGSTAEVSGKVAALFARTILRRDGSCSPRPTGQRLLGRKEVPEWRFRIQDHGQRTGGTLVFRTRVWPDGSLMVVGYGAGDGAEAKPRPLFEDFARGMTFKGKKSRAR